jgi:hypothetical protein
VLVTAVDDSPSTFGSMKELNVLRILLSSGMNIPNNSDVVGLLPRFVMVSAKLFRWLSGLGLRASEC